MRQKFVLLMVMISMLIIPFSSTHAQDANAPLYVRFCTAIRADIGDETLQKGMTDVDNLAVIVTDLLSSYDSGNLTIPEGVARGEEVAQLWGNTAKVDCLATMNQDVYRLTNELIIMMLYGQALDLQGQNRHRAIVDQLLTTIDSQIDLARTYLARPLPTATLPPSPTVTTETATTPEPTVEGTPTLRSSDEMSDLLTAYLEANNITVLRRAAVQVFPSDTLVVIELDRFVGANGNTFDYENTIFTLDAMAGFWEAQPEVSEISQVAIETYDGTERTLYVATTGADFRARYIDDTLSATDFEAQLTIQPPLE